MGLYLAAKRAHWIVQGPRFVPLHELFGKVADDAAETADKIAERIAQMDGTPTDENDTFSITEKNGVTLLPQLLSAMDTCAASNNKAIVLLLEMGDQVSANMLMGLEESLEKLMWMVRKSQQAGV